MPLNPAPIAAEPLAKNDDGSSFFSMPWAQWFRRLVDALAGWNTTRFYEVSVTFGNIPASGINQVNQSVPGVRIGDIPILNPNNGTPGGLLYLAFVSADDIVSFQAVNYTAVGPVLGFTAPFTLIIFRQ